MYTHPAGRSVGRSVGSRHAQGENQELFTTVEETTTAAAGAWHVVNLGPNEMNDAHKAK